ncbi:MAG: hypothetical protein LBT39_10595 [Treponema sp.]|jgi:hypothetical protein|nr:hypothetical protein [Treponema sp.]
MPKNPENIVPISQDDYTYRKEVYDRQRKIYEDGMRVWEGFNNTSRERDARFD